MRTPIQKFALREEVTARFLYKEAAAGRLVLTKVGSRTFIDDIDAEAWRALAPKVTGKAGDVALKVAEQKLQELSTAIAKGYIDRQIAVDRLFTTAKRLGLNQDVAHAIK